MDLMIALALATLFLWLWMYITIGYIVVNTYNLTTRVFNRLLTVGGALGLLCIILLAAKIYSTLVGTLPSP